MLRNYEHVAPCILHEQHPPSHDLTYLSFSIVAGRHRIHHHLIPHSFLYHPIEAESTYLRLLCCAARGKREGGGVYQIVTLDNINMAYNEDSSASGHDEPWIQWYVT